MQETSETRSVKWLMGLIETDPGLNQLAQFAAENLSPDPGHDYAHALRVALWGLRIGDGAESERHIIAAALLHDIVNPPKNSELRKQASALSADKAESILPDYGFDQAAIRAITAAIRDHSYSRGATPKERLGKILQDADRLEALGAIGIMRCVSTGVQMGGQLFHATDPWAKNRKQDDKSYSIDHFFIKLFRLPETMQTEAGRKEALDRIERMHDFLSALGDEIGHPWESNGKLSP